MFKEYKTIKEVVGPLLLVEGVAGVKYNELVEIVQKDGEVRHGKVLEVHRDKALVQLFESSQGLQISTSRAKFLGAAWNFPFPKICSAAYSTAWGDRATGARPSLQISAWT